MKIKVGTMIYDSNEQPVMVILGPLDKNNIRDMAPEATRYCAYPPGMTIMEVEAFMQIEETLGTGMFRGRRIYQTEDGVSEKTIDGHLSPTQYQVWDYWKDDRAGWMAYAPSGIGSLANHEVVEHADQTITVSPSILVTGEGQWHGYLERGIWREV